MPVEITDSLTDEQLRHIADSKDTGTCRARIRAALSAALTQAAEQPVKWQAKYHDDTVWVDIPKDRVEEFRATGKCDIRGLYARPPCDSRTEALEEIVKMIENCEWESTPQEETVEDVLKNIVATIRALSEAGRSAMKEEGD